MWLKAGGIGVLERQLFVAARAGIKSVWIGTHEPDPAVLAGLRVPPGLEVRWVPRGGGALTECLPPYAGISGDHFLHPSTLSHIVRQRFGESVSYDDDAGLGVVQVVLTRDESTARVKQPLPPGSYRRLEAPIGGEETVSWLMASGPKSADGFMARHFDRHISLSVSRLLLDTTVTPNMMTVSSTALGLAGAAFFLLPTQGAHAAGALLVWLHSVLDGCDGELARVRFQESPLGSDLDFWGDNLVHVALFSCLGAGFWLSGKGPLPLVLGAVASLTTLASAWGAWRHRLARRAAGGGPEAGVTEVSASGGLDTKLARLENTLAQRDFIYLLVFLAFAGLDDWFLWAAAVGGLLYFGIMLYLRRVNDNEQARQPHPAR
jgi:phosphatidylglycerophosphate synthase